MRTGQDVKRKEISSTSSSRTNVSTGKGQKPHQHLGWAKGYAAYCSRTCERETSTTAGGIQITKEKAKTYQMWSRLESSWIRIHREVAANIIFRNSSRVWWCRPRRPLVHRCQGWRGKVNSREWRKIFLQSSAWHTFFPSMSVRVHLLPGSALVAHIYVYSICQCLDYQWGCR